MWIAFDQQQLERENVKIKGTVVEDNSSCIYIATVVVITVKKEEIINVVLIQRRGRIYDS